MHLLQALRLFVAAGMVTTSQAPLFAAVAVPHLHDTQETVSRAAANILEVLPLGTLSSIVTGVALANGSAVRRHFASSIQTTAFTMEHFDNVVPPLVKQARSKLASTGTNTLPVMDAAVLSSVLDTCCLAEGTSPRGGATVLSHAYPAMQQLLFACCARYCAEHRLSTSFGRADKTLEAMERPVQELAKALDAGRGQPLRLALRPLDRPPSALDETQMLSPAFEAVEQQAVSRLMLLWLEALERQLMHGCTPIVAFPSLPPPSQLFFRANGAVCFDWLARMRIPLVLASSAAASPPSVVYHGMEGLQRLAKELRAVDTRRSSRLTQFRRLCVSVAESLIQLRRGDLLQGLASWAWRTLGDSASTATDSMPDADSKQVDWLNAAAEEAAGGLSAAAEGYKSVILASLSPAGAAGLDAADAEVLAFASARSLQCLAMLGDMDELAAWQHQLADYRASILKEAEAMPEDDKKQLSNLALAVGSHLADDNRRWAVLGAFDRNDYDAAESLLGDSSSSPQTAWDLHACENSVYDASLRAMLLLRKNCAESRVQAVSLAERAAELAKAMTVGSMAESDLLANRHQALMLGITLLRDAARPGKAVGAVSGNGDGRTLCAAQAEPHSPKWVTMDVCFFFCTHNFAAFLMSNLPDLSADAPGALQFP
jgi:hypothetical protein